PDWRGAAGAGGPRLSSLPALAAGDLEPRVHRRARALRQPPAAALERAEHDLPLAPVGLAGPPDVRLVVPGGDRGTLDELLRRGADRRPELLQSRDHLSRAGDEARPVARHGRALAQGVEDDDAVPVRDLERRGRRLVEPQLAVGLVGGDEEVVLRGQLREPLVEDEGRDGARRVVRVVDPEDRDAAPGLVVERVEIREEAALLAQRQL